MQPFIRCFPMFVELIDSHSSFRRENRNAVINMSQKTYMNALLKFKYESVKNVYFNKCKKRNVFMRSQIINKNIRCKPSSRQIFR